VQRGQALKCDEVLLTQDELLARLRSSEEKVLVTPDDAVDKLLKQNSIAVRLMERPASDFIARLGLGKIRRGETVSVEELDANYIRRSDAEIFSLPKLR
ncbi:MAG: hypothetical protein L0Z53_12530, partial [Acidobacteriales bacterium]|nr:hypothetical protein [Terriglobales bacterium]